LRRASVHARRDSGDSVASSEILAAAGLIECRREGQFAYSEANPKRLQEYARAMTALSSKKES
jgi:hypothetical protein